MLYCGSIYTKTNIMLDSLQIHIKRMIYRLRHDYLTLNNIVFAAALLIALSWTWNSVETMQQNYELQQTVDRKKQQLVLEQLHVDTLELEGRYYNTLEYQELAVRQRLGKGMPGERALIVPSTDAVEVVQNSTAPVSTQTSNVQEWMNFLLGRRQEGL